MTTLWCASYFSLMPRRIEIVSSTEGWLTNTCWNRRSRAASFSMYWRYSSSVVAPIMRSSPRASSGFSMLPASIAPSPLAPAPTTVCSSSMNVMIWPSLPLISSRTAFSRSSNSPRYFAPATIAPRSRAMRLLPCNDVGTSPSTMRRASPSTTAVLPTPGSPMRTGLFLVRRESTWMVRRTSSSRPMTGSIFPSRARAVRSMPNFSSAWKVCSGSLLVTRALPFTCSSASMSAAGVAPCWASRSLTPGPPSFASAMRRCSVLTNSSPRSFANVSAALMTLYDAWLSWGAATLEPDADGSDARAARTWCVRPATSTPTADSSAVAMPSPCWSRESSRWRGSTCGLPLAAAMRTAAPRASWLLVVNWMSIALSLVLLGTTCVAPDATRPGLSTAAPGGTRPRCAAAAPPRPGAQGPA